MMELMESSSPAMLAAAVREDLPRSGSSVPALNVVVVDEELCHPATSGHRIRALNLMVRLARRHRIVYLARRHPDPEQTRRAVKFLADQGVECLTVDDPVVPKRGPRFYGRLAANLLSPLPYSVAAHQSPALLRAARAHAARRRVDLWQFEWMAYADPLLGLGGAPGVVVAHNVEALIWQRYHETEPNPLKRWYIRGQWRKFQRFEQRVFRRAERVIAVSPDDARLVREDLGVPHVEVVENGMDGRYFGAVSAQREPGRLLFLGSLDWRPNLDAVNLLLDRIFPEVLAREPSARLVLVGRNPPPALVRRVQTQPRVALHADVADVRPFLASSAALVVPLRIGGGSRLKILEALAAGLPVVSTRVGAEGLDLVAGRDLVVAEVADMAEALLECLRQPARATTMAEHGRALVRERYDWDVLAGRLERVWCSCLRKPGARTASREGRA